MKPLNTIYFLVFLVLLLGACESDKIQETNCSISDLHVTVGNCTSPDTYSLTLNFEYENPANNSFDVFVRDSVFIGNYELADLPITIENFETSGLEYDYIKVCINDHPDCCEVIEFLPPDCP